MYFKENKEEISTENRSMGQTNASLIYILMHHSIDNNRIWPSLRLCWVQEVLCFQIVL